MRHYVREVGFSALQLNVDGFMVCAVVLTCCFVMTDTHYTMFDIAEGIFCSFVSMGGTVSLTKALNCGKGGPIQAIDSLKSLIPLALNVMFRGLVPSWLQFGGVCLGILGAGVVALNKG